MDIDLYIDEHTLYSEEGTTQGDPLAMPVYALAVIALIDSLLMEDVQRVWYTDDATAL